ncbi:MAG: glutaredoxin [Pelagibacteraceae bacterium TMED247]|nr:MAG: glutaredoxin [Pelagibacteraceae bacterium TMED247]|tara:strand:+ start:7060 stop:7314 length:255 start_codon:yes stop_codon:yes gene_type:complete
MIEIWGKPNCPYCDMAVNLCKTKKYAHEYKSLGKDFTTEELFEVFPDARTFPQIRNIMEWDTAVFKEEYIGGYNELKSWVDDVD